MARKKKPATKPISGHTPNPSKNSMLSSNIATNNTSHNTLEQSIERSALGSIPILDLTQLETVPEHVPTAPSSPTVSSLRPSLKLNPEDVADEINFWKTSAICFILGANPPWEIVNGFIKRIWGKFDYDKISHLPNGVFLVHFKTMAILDQVLQSGYQLFDNKPMIVKPWTPQAALVKEDVKTVPTWVRLRDLEHKFWGEACLHKITGLVGTPVRVDEATIQKTRLGFARILTEVEVGQVLPDVIEFEDELGYNQEIKVEYEWKPVKCQKCSAYGHEGANCRRGITKPPRVWKQKEPAPKIPAPVVTVPLAATAVQGDTSLAQPVTSAGRVPVTFLEVLNSAIQQTATKKGPILNSENG
ncbi:hypothetical protein vseg_010861 [Gypsophila vaccaria]